MLGTRHAELKKAEATRHPGPEASNTSSFEDADGLFAQREGSGPPKPESVMDPYEQSPRVRARQMKPPPSARSSRMRPQPSTRSRLAQGVTAGAMQSVRRKTSSQASSQASAQAAPLGASRLGASTLGVSAAKAETGNDSDGSDDSGEYGAAVAAIADSVGKVANEDVPPSPTHGEPAADEPRAHRPSTIEELYGDDFAEPAVEMERHTLGPDFLEDAPPAAAAAAASSAAADAEGEAEGEDDGDTVRVRGGNSVTSEVLRTLSAITSVATKGTKGPKGPKGDATGTGKAENEVEDPTEMVMGGIREADEAADEAASGLGRTPSDPVPTVGPAMAVDTVAMDLDLTGGTSLAAPSGPEGERPPRLQSLGMLEAQRRVSSANEAQRRVSSASAYGLDAPECGMRRGSQISDL